MRTKQHSKLKSISNIITATIFLAVGTLFFLGGLLPKTIEIDPAGTEINAYIHSKSVFPPFEDIHEFIPNVRGSIVDKYKGGKGQTYYKVVLETYDGRRFSITPGSRIQFFKQNLQELINNSIKSRTPLKKTVLNTNYMACGIFLIIIGFAVALPEIKTAKRKIRIKRRREKYKEKKALERALGINQQQPIEPEPEKYKDINDSIIK